MRFLWWEGRDWLLGLAVAVAALVAATATAATGSDVVRAAARVQPGMSKEEAEGLLGGPGEEDREGFRFSVACGGPRPWFRTYTRSAYRGVLTTVEVDYDQYMHGPVTVTAVRTRPALATLPENWFYAAAALGLVVTEVSRRARRRAARRCP